MVDIPTDLIIHGCVCICIYGNECIYETEDNKTVMGHNRHYNQKGDNKEFGVWIRDKSENGEQ